MAEDGKRPVLQLVTEEVAQGVLGSAGTPPEPSPINIVEADAFAKHAASLDAAVPLLAGYLVCAGSAVADAAIDFYHSAAAFAPQGTFRHGIPPGMKAAEATRAWLSSHLSAIKTMGRRTGGTNPYARHADLQDAVQLAATELQRALGVTQSVGMHFGDRYKAILTDAKTSLDRPLPVSAEAAHETIDGLIFDDTTSLYDIGAFVLGMR